MRLTRVEFACLGSGGVLLNGLALEVRKDGEADFQRFQPLCIVGPNGSGKSQFLQSTAEVLQAALHAAVPKEERREVDPASGFTIRYMLRRDPPAPDLEVEIKGTPASGDARPISIRTRELGGEWSEFAPVSNDLRALLPSRIVAYTSGENETLSLPFLISRFAYGDEIQRRAIPITGGKGKDSDNQSAEPAGAPRLMLIDYSTHLEVLVANLLLGAPEQRDYLLEQVHLQDIRSVRCIISLNHGAVKSTVQRRPDSKRKGVQLTDELERYITILQNCATTWDYDDGKERLVLDFWVNEETRKAFAANFAGPFDLYLAFHKFALLNSLAISNPARKRFEADVRKRRFATRLPEPPEEDKVFRFQEMTFYLQSSDQTSGPAPVDYVSLSDGEHQLVQILGLFAMMDEPNVLFLLDEPESHLNPQWRVQFMSRIAKLPMAEGGREFSGSAAMAQEVLITTHAPFVPSDLPREQVLVFNRNESDGDDQSTPVVRPRRPNIQTFGANYEEILEHCFGVSPPISQQPLEVIERLMESKDPEQVEAGLQTLGPSVERVQLVDHLDDLKQS